MKLILGHERATIGIALKKTLCEYSAHRGRRLHPSSGKSCFKKVEALMVATQSGGLAYKKIGGHVEQE